jgi:hypothetical protein
MLVVYTPSTKDPTPEAFSFGAEAASNLSNNLAKFGPSTSIWLVPGTEAGQ